ncbi:MAG TPA: ABC transporter ATP-binding protein, partial [Arcobacter sp.]|nr:ABC transporter ATP-binding protein [Arcobacter sp.]
YNEQREYEILPDEIDSLEEQIKKMNQCLMDPECYQEKGLVTLSNELDKLKTEYDNKVERYLELEEIIEELQK